VNILNKNICDQLGFSLNQYLSPAQMNCQNFIYNSTSFGLNVILTNFIEEIRQMKFKNGLLLNKQSEVYNSLKTILEIYYSNITIQFQVIPLIIYLLKK